jgi:hypothetical protein
MNINLSVDVTGLNVNIHEEAPETVSGSRGNTMLTMTLAHGIQRLCRALDVNVYDLAGLISGLRPEQQDEDAKLAMRAETWPLFVTSYPEDDDVTIVYCGDKECPLDAENSEIMRLETELDDQGDMLGSTVTIRSLREQIMGHIVLVDERKNDVAQA